MTQDDAVLILEILQSLEKKVDFEYRLYYNEQGLIYEGSIHKSDPIISEKYIVTDKETYDNSFKYRVVSGKLELHNTSSGMRSQIKKSNTGFRTVKNHPCLILDSDEEYPDIEYYDYTSN